MCVCVRVIKVFSFTLLKAEQNNLFSGFIQRSFTRLSEIKCTFYFLNNSWKKKKYFLFLSFTFFLFYRSSFLRSFVITLDLYNLHFPSIRSNTGYFLKVKGYDLITVNSYLYRNLLPCWLICRFIFWYLFFGYFL